MTFLLNNYHCTICKSKLLSGTETSLRRALISNNSGTLVLKKELWVGTKIIGAGRGGTGRDGAGRAREGGVLFFLHPLENKSLTRKQAKKTKKTDISREQHSKQANIRQGKL